MRILPLPFLSLICSLSIWLTSTVCVTAANYPGATCARGRCESPLCQKCATKKLASQKHFCDAVEFEKCACEKCVTKLATASCGGVAATNTGSVATKQFTVVLTCPSDARVTIGGQLTYATGSTRQYQLQYDDKRRTYRLEMKVRINEENATFLFDHDIHCDDGKILALAVTREQMTKVSDTHWSAEIAKHLQPNTVLRVTDDQKLELLSSGTENADSTSKPMSSSNRSSSTPPSVSQRLMDRKKEQVLGWDNKAKKLKTEIATKTAHRDAVALICQRTEDAWRIKLEEVNAAVTDSAATLAGRRLEAKRLELELNHARENQAQAQAALTSAQQEANNVDKEIAAGQEALRLLRVAESIEKQARIVNAANARTVRLRKDVDVKSARLGVLQKSLVTAESLKLGDATQAAELREVVAQTKAEYEAAFKNWTAAVTDMERKQNDLNVIHATEPE